MYKGVESKVSVLRGGAWNNNNDRNLRSCNRNNNQPHNRNNNVGFRVVCSASELSPRMCT
ncbi:MAG: SUMF1/EgtB/PvdO family nonheme iron enzyme [Spirochaetales bacterium]|nr:SUMF1/EgtB/PvdO family nonheme iron enzyme [Spirochaetales bacterium]